MADPWWRVLAVAGFTLYYQLVARRWTAWTFSHYATVISRYLSYRRRPQPPQPTSDNRRPHSAASVDVPSRRYRVQFSSKRWKSETKDASCRPLGQITAAICIALTNTVNGPSTVVNSIFHSLQRLLPSSGLPPKSIYTWKMFVTLLLLNVYDIANERTGQSSTV